MCVIEAQLGAEEENWVKLECCSSFSKDLCLPSLPTAGRLIGEIAVVSNVLQWINFAVASRELVICLQSEAINRDAHDRQISRDVCRVSRASLG